MTFENNTIVDVPGMCAVFRQLRQFEKLESLNFRCNKNFTDDIVAALAEGITLKKELRVSLSFLINHCLPNRPLTSARTTFQTTAFRFWVRH